MKRSLIAAALAVTVAATLCHAGSKPKPAAKSAAKPAAVAPADTLDAGSYSAQVKRIVCGGCGALIEDAMNGVSGVEGTKVNVDSGEVKFGVKKGAAVKWADVKKALKDAEEMMGMGASYDLSGLKKNG